MWKTPLNVTFGNALKGSDFYWWSGRVARFLLILVCEC